MPILENLLKLAKFGKNEKKRSYFKKNKTF